MKNLKKITSNLLFSLFVSAILGLLIWSRPNCSLSCALLISGCSTILFLIISSLFGDNEFNITLGWNKKVNRIKDSIGGTIAIIVMFTFLAVMLIIASLLFDPAVW